MNKALALKNMRRLGPDESWFSIDELSDHFIIGDALAVMSVMPPDSVDLIVTSPPYNLGMKYAGSQNDTRSWGAYFRWTQKWLFQAHRVLKQDGRICINHYLSCGDAVRGRVAPLMTINSLAEVVGLRHHGLAVWNDATVSRPTAWGSWLSASSPYINSPYEGILIMYKRRWKRDRRGVSTIGKQQFLDGTHGVWKLRSERRKDHPAPFSPDLPSMCINLLSYEGDIVLDPFVGTGTTCIEAATSGRHFIGIDISSKYIRSAVVRMGKEF